MDYPDLFGSLLLGGLFIVAVRYLQDSVLFRPDLPSRTARRKWLLAGLAALLLVIVNVVATLVVLALATTSAALTLILTKPLVALVIVKLLFWAVGALPFMWLFKVPFWTAIKGSAWAVFIAVLTDLVLRMTVFLAAGTLLKRPLAMGSGLAALALLAGVVLVVRRRQGKRLAELADTELSEAEQQQIAAELADAPPASAAEAAMLAEPLQAYCPSCAAATPPEARHCPFCGSVMDQLELDLIEQHRPLHQGWIAIFVGGVSALLVLASLLPGVKQLVIGMKFPAELGLAAAAAKIPVTVTGGFVGIGVFLALFVIVGAVVGTMARRPVYREIAVGGVALTLVSWLIWIIRAAGDAGRLFSGPMSLSGPDDQVLLSGPMPMFLLAMNLLGLLAGVGAARLAVHVLIERGDGKRRKRKTLRWALPVAGGTMLSFLLATWLAGPYLSFYWRCDFAQPSGGCIEATHSFNSSLMKLKATVTEDDQQRRQHPGIILHPWKYIGYLALLFFLAPLLVAWRSGARAAGVTIALNAAGSLLLALLLLGFALGGRAFSGAIQIQMIATLVWSAAGGVGTALGAKRYRGVDLLDPDLDEDATRADRELKLGLSTR